MSGELEQVILEPTLRPLILNANLPPVVVVRGRDAQYGFIPSDCTYDMTEVVIAYNTLTQGLRVSNYDWQHLTISSTMGNMRDLLGLEPETTILDILNRVKSVEEEDPEGLYPFTSNLIMNTILFASYGETQWYTYEPPVSPDARLPIFEFDFRGYNPSTKMEIRMVEIFGSIRTYWPETLLEELMRCHMVKEEMVGTNA